MRRALALSVIAALVCACGANDSASSADSGASDASDSSVAPTDASSDAHASIDDAGDGPLDAAIPLPALPLRTESRWIVDAHGKRFKLAGVNWYGAESKDFAVAGLDRAPLAAIAKSVRTMGFDSVRLPWSNEMLETNPVVDPARLTANPALAGKRALDVLDAVVAALAHEGIVVILDNHRSHADWCCDVQHGDGLWYTSDYPESKWLDDWRAMVRRYANEPAVVGVDLRNELRPVLDANAPSTCTACSAGCPCKTPAWGGSDPSVDWRAAAMRAGDAVLAVNPSLLVVVEGLDYALDLGGAYANPAKLSIDHRLVYSAHDYSFSHAPYATYDAMKTDLGSAWGFLLTQNQPFTAPVWVGEFGTDDRSASSVDDTTGQGFWFANLRRYLAEADVDWCYWALNGTEAAGYSRTRGAPETYGVLNPSWTAPALPELSAALRAMQPATQGP